MVHSDKEVAGRHVALVGIDGNPGTLLELFEEGGEGEGQMEQIGTGSLLLGGRGR